MIDSLYIAWKYITANRAKTITLVACITLIAILPISLELLLNESERQLLSRAVTTPLVVGARGSSLDLVMNTLYFGDEIPELITMETADQVLDSGLALPIPVYVRYQARGYPIVGTTLDYFEFRGLTVGEGRQLAILGDCIIGASVAEKLGIGPGGGLISSPESLLDLAGVYPLKMYVAGVLDKSHTTDDLAVFVDLKTTWVIEGMGHGHMDVTKTADKSLVLRKTDTNVAATAKLEHYNEITDENIDTFHFHGNTSIYPVTAVIAVPHDEKSGTILQGRYLSKEEMHMIVKPEEVVDTMLQNIFRIRNVLDAVILVVGFATILAIVLVFALSVRLRKREIGTIFRLGCRKLTIARFLGAEIIIIIALGAVICTGLLFLLNHYASDLVRMFFIR
jgi:putative ABC transport system permease protein